MDMNGLRVNRGHGFRLFKPGIDNFLSATQACGKYTLAGNYPSTVRGSLTIEDQGLLGRVENKSSSTFNFTPNHQSGISPT